MIKDFGDPSYPKYVFNGISEFVHNRAVIITGDNYAQQGALYMESEIRINIFNISKFNSENSSRKGIPRMKRLSEYLGESYWKFLSSLDDLVVLMDEAHRYHADASKKAIDELNPVLGIELTATPTDEKGKSFKNIVYEYTLAKALADGLYVKSPTIAKRKTTIPEEKCRRSRAGKTGRCNFHSPADQDRSRNICFKQWAEISEAFVLVVCKDITHAKAVYDLINSTSFYSGQFIGKVLQIDSSTKRMKRLSNYLFRSKILITRLKS